MPITEKSSVPEIRRYARQLDDLLQEPEDLQQRNDTKAAMSELRGVIHRKLSAIAHTRKGLTESIEMARDGNVTVLLQPEDVPELERENQQWLNVQNELIEILSTHL